MKRLASSEQEIRDLLVKLEAAKQLNETLIKTDRENLAQNREEIARLKLLKRNLASDKAESEKKYSATLQDLQNLKAEMNQGADAFQNKVAELQAELTKRDDLLDASESELARIRDRFSKAQA